MSPNRALGCLRLSVWFLLAGRAASCVFFGINLMGMEFIGLIYWNFHFYHVFVCWILIWLWSDHKTTESMINWDNLGELTAATCKRSAVPQRPVECHESPKDWPLRSGPASGQHHAADAAFLDGRPSLRCSPEELWWGRASRPYGCAICCQRVFQEFARWAVPGSTEGTTKAASGNRCVQRGTVCIAWLHLWWAAWSTGGGWSWTPTTCRCFRLAKVGRWNCGMHPCPLGLRCRPASSARPICPSFFERCIWR